MKSIRIGNDIRIVWPIVLSGDVSKLQDLDLTVEVRPSAKIIDTHNYADEMPDKDNEKRPVFIKTETTVMMNGGITCRPDIGDGKEHCRPRPCPPHPHRPVPPAPVRLPYHIEDNTLIAMWTADRQFATGDYDIILYAHKNEGGQAVCDQYRFVRLVSHTSQADAPDDSGIEAIIAMQPVTLSLSGLSAYEVAVINGFQGSVEEWLASLKGTPGAGAEVVQETGDSESAVMSQKAVTDTILNKIDLSEIDLDSSTIAGLSLAGVPTRYNVVSKDKSCGVMDVFGDGMGHMLTQVFKTHYKVENGILTTTHSDNEIFQYYRSYHIVEGGTSDIPVGTWGEWKEIKSGSTGADISELTNRVTEIEKEIWPLNIELNIAPNIVEANTVNDVTVSWNATLKDNEVNDYCEFTLNDESITGTSKKLTINESTPTTKAFKLVATYNDRTNQVSSNLYVVGAMYFGFSNESSNANLVLTNLVKQSLKTSPIGTYTLQNLESGNYMWLCVPDNMSINDVTLNGFNVPMEVAQDKQQGNITYRCYRSNHALVQGSYKVKIS